MSNNNIKAGKIALHFSDPFIDSDKYMDKRINNALNSGGFINFWQAFFFCHREHTFAEKFFYLFTERQLFYLRKWVENITGDNGDCLKTSLQNFFSKIQGMNGKRINVSEKTYYIKRKSSNKSKTIFIQKLVKVIFKLRVDDEKNTSQLSYFLTENWSAEKNDKDKPEKYLKEMFGETLKDATAKEYFGTNINKDGIVLYLGDDYGYVHPKFFSCDKLNTSCPFYDTVSSTITSDK